MNKKLIECFAIACCCFVFAACQPDPEEPETPSNNLGEGNWGEMTYEETNN